MKVAAVAAVKACAARVNCTAVESVVAKHVTEVVERAQEATEKEVAAEGEMAQQRVEEAWEVAARVVATVVAAEIVAEATVVVLTAAAMAATATAGQAKAAGAWARARAVVAMATAVVEMAAAGDGWRSAEPAGAAVGARQDPAAACRPGRHAQPEQLVPRRRGRGLRRGRVDPADPVRRGRGPARQDRVVGRRAARRARRLPGADHPSAGGGALAAEPRPAMAAHPLAGCRCALRPRHRRAGAAGHGAAVL